MAPTKKIIDRNNPAFAFLSVTDTSDDQATIFDKSGEDSARILSREQAEIFNTSSGDSAAIFDGKTAKEPETAAAPDGYYIDPKYIEKKQRYNICLTPTLKAIADKKADELGISFSAYLEKLIKNDNH